MRLADFHLLLLEDDPKSIREMAEASDQAGLGQRLRVVRNCDEAVSALSPAPGTFADVRPRPILLASLSCRSAFELLEYLARDPVRRPAVCIGLVPADDGVLLRRAYRLGVNSCLVRPGDPADQHAMFRSIREYWEVLNVTPDWWSSRPGPQRSPDLQRRAR